MSITPFLPGLPAPVPTDGAPAATDQAGDLGVVFGDALAAALLATVPLPATPAPAVEVRGAPAPSLETTGLEAGTGLLPSLPAAPAEVSRLVAGAPRTSTTEEPVASAPTTPATPAAPKVPAPGTAAVVEVRGRPRPSLETTGSDAGSQPLANLPTASPGVSRLVAGAPQPSTTATPTVERAVVQQVFPEVTRVVTTTPTDRPGTHRITLTLQPEQLGEVRVTLVVKDGAVQVRLAGSANDPTGSAAVHRALSTGVPELQRLLERAGATEARVLVRDPFSPQPAAPQATAAAATSDPGTDQSQSQSHGHSRWDRPPPPAPHANSSYQPGNRDQNAWGAEPSATTPTTTPSGQLDRSL